MAQYKVPQDVEADDKLLGPFSFRQFIYLLVAGGLIAAAIGLFRIFPILAIIPVPIIFFFLILALPIKKDQPMETYLAALVSFYLKPRKRYWIAGQRESTITITTPKKVEAPRTRNITEDEASHRLSFLAEIVDTEGYSIKNANTPMRDEFAAEATTAQDIFDTNNTNNLNQMINRETAEHHTEIIDKMRKAIDRAETLSEAPTIERFTSHQSSSNMKPTISPKPAEKPKITSTKPVKPGIIELANNKDYSIETIQKEARRINDKKSKNEVYIALR